ncbi:sporulation-delaying protein SdpB family protein [Streptomyces sp. AK02-01A]|uniref:sporulation-delaying protein SdpB family protein n=1 Tax=Streptomyces sp. AK02-01A TaxID=3028648 RepID=UPI0029B6FF0E|nr:sporulation-delaying protein SdpB family protein [Streptomyces sp. AK02-01A]MDX3853408.1 hypothetical protein [Streptomyces sp. AK02-01A]
MLMRIPVPWTNVYGIARTLIALGTAGTLLFSSTETLFRPVATVGDHPQCDGVKAAGAFCMVAKDDLGWVQWACIAVLLVIAAGWRPRWTALPHAYVNFSVYTGIAISDGGDQIAMNLSLLLVLPALGDRRRWHWSPSEEVPSSKARQVWSVLGISALAMAQLQMSILYFQSSVAKFSHAEWADGSAMYYWANDPSFGAPSWLRPLLDPFVTTPLWVALLTWVPLLIELSLAASLLLPLKVRKVLLVVGLAFHLSIAVMTGLWSFAAAMWGGLALLCLPLGTSLSLRKAHAPTGPEPGEPESTEPTSSATSSSDSPALRASVTS